MRDVDSSSVVALEVSIGSVTFLFCVVVIAVVIKLLAVDVDLPHGKGVIIVIVVYVIVGILLEALYVCSFWVKESVSRSLRSTSEEAPTRQSLTLPGRTTIASIALSIPSLDPSKRNTVELGQTQALLEQETCYKAISGPLTSKQKLIKF